MLCQILRFLSLSPASPLGLGVTFDYPVVALSGCLAGFCCCACYNKWGIITNPCHTSQIWNWKKKILWHLTNKLNLVLVYHQVQLYKCPLKQMSCPLKLITVEITYKLNVDIIYYSSWNIPSKKQKPEDRVHFLFVSAQHSEEIIMIL